MPYSITTKDGITVRGIPDDVPPDSIELKAKVEAVRRGEIKGRPSDGASEQIPGYVAPAPAAPEPGLGQQIVGAGEAAITAITAPFAYLNGLAAGGNTLVKRMLAEAVGQPDAARFDPGQAYEQASQAATYTPRTAAGQDAAAVVAEVGQGLAPLAGLTGQMGQLAQAGSAARTGAPAATAARAAAEGTARDIAGPAGAAVVSKAADTAAALPAAIKSAYDTTAARVSKGFGMSDAATRAEGGSVGAAGVERATRLNATASGLPVPVRLTRGEATGDAAQIRFEQEQGKGSLGAPLRDRSAETNRALGQNLEAVIDETGAVTGSNIETGRSVAGTIASAEARERVRERGLWRKADEEGALSDLVDLQPVADYLNQNRAGRSSAPIMDVIARELDVQGLGGGSLDAGTLTIGPVTLKQAEGLRKAVNKFVKEADRNDLRVGSDIKKSIDTQTEGLGNGSYQEARKATQRREQLFGQNTIVSQLLRNRKGTADRQVALGEVFDQTILNGSREELGMLRRTLDVSDQRQGIKPGTTGDGAQAWRELQGATVRKLLDEATKGFAVAQDGAQRFSGAQYLKTLRDLDRDGKLDFVMGKQRAQLLRDVGEIARTVQAFPAGAVNSSNTASVILQAIGEAGLTGSLTGLPVPAISLIRAGSQALKDGKTKARIRAALGNQ